MTQKHWFNINIRGKGNVEVKAENPTEALRLAREKIGQPDAVPAYECLYNFQVEARGNWDMIHAEEYPTECQLPWPFTGQNVAEWRRGASGY